MLGPMLQVEVTKLQKAFRHGHFFPHVWFLIKVSYGNLPYEWVIWRSHSELHQFYGKLRNLELQSAEFDQIKAPPRHTFGSHHDGGLPCCLP